MTPEEIQDIEIHILLETLFLRYGYDFRGYADASLKRRILHCLAACQLNHVSEIIPRMLYEGRFLKRLIGTLTVTVTTLFRDPPVFQSLREYVVPMLATYPFINVWNAGCATGEEVYATAILLKEGGMLDRARIYATDLDDEGLQIAQEGIYGVDRLEEFTKNYQRAGGQGVLSDFCHVKNGAIHMDPALREHITFSTHNLAGDAVFTETHLILCRNVLIYFDKPLQERVLHLFYDSLVRGGYLCLGSHESLEFTKLRDEFKPVAKKHRICQKRIRHRKEK